MNATAAIAWSNMDQYPGRVGVAVFAERMRHLVVAMRGWMLPSSSFREVMAANEFQEAQEMEQTMFCCGASVLALRLMRADGAPNSKERTSFLALFTLAGMGRGKLASLFAAASKDHAPTLQYARQINALLQEDEALRHEFMLRLARLALADAPLEKSEFSLLCEIGRALGFSRAAVSRLVLEADSPMAGSPEAVLRIAAGASPEQVQAAYRERVRYSHPDRWQGTEEYSELYRLATLKTAAVNEAYRTLTQQGAGRWR